MTVPDMPVPATRTDDDAAGIRAAHAAVGDFLRDGQQWLPAAAVHAATPIIVAAVEARVRAEIAEAIAEMPMRRELADPFRRPLFAFEVRDEAAAIARGVS